MTIVSNSHEFIFAHIPKTGGTSVKWLLSPLLQPQDTQIGGPSGFGDQSGVPIPLRKHSTFGDIQKVIGEERFQRFFKFSIVRNPFARATSTFRFLKYKFRNFPNADIMDRFTTLDEFIASDFFTRPGPSGMFNPQTAWLKTADALCADYLGRVESFEEDTAEILRRLNLKARKLEQRNISEQRGKGDLRISNTSAEIIRNRYAVDFENFGYSLKVDALLHA